MKWRFTQFLHRPHPKKRVKNTRIIPVQKRNGQLNLFCKQNIFKNLYIVIMEYAYINI